MKRPFAKTILAVLVVTMTLFVLNNAAWSAEKKPIKLRYGHFDPPMSPWAAPMKSWAKALEERSGGRVTVEFSWAVAHPGELFYLTEKGIVDIGFSVPTFGSPGQFPFAEIVGLPFVFPTAETSTRAMTEFNKRGYLDKAFEKVKVLHFLSATGDIIYTSKKSVTTLADLKGLKLHAGTPLIQRRVKLIGGVPIQISYPDMYGAFQKGIIDGMVLNWAIMAIFRIYEVTKYAIPPAIGTGSMVVVMNKKTWKKLPADVQAFIDETSEQYAIEYIRAWDAINDRGKKLFLDNGGQILEWKPGEINKMKALITPIWDEWITDMEKKGLPGRKAVDDLYYILKDLGIEDPAVGYKPAK